MELDELVTKIINHIDETKKDTIREVKSLIDETKDGIMQEVNVLLEDQRSQFNTFGEGLDTLRDQMNRRFDEVDQRFDKNDSAHQSLQLMIQELAVDQTEIQRKVKDLEQEFELELRG